MNSHFQSHLQAYSQAVLTQNLDLFSSIYDENIQAYDMWEKWSVEGLNDWRAMTKDWFDSLKADSEKCAVEFFEIKEKFSGELGYVTAIVKFEAQTLAGEKIRFLENRLTWILERKSASWKIIHQHTSAPLDSSAKAIFRR